MTKQKNINKFTELALKELKHSEEVSKWSYKELADYAIQNIWSDEKIIKLGTLKCAALDRMINILFNLHDLENTTLKVVANFNENQK
jgi:hypothetical protein